MQNADRGRAAAEANVPEPATFSPLPGSVSFLAEDAGPIRAAWVRRSMPGLPNQADQSFPVSAAEDHLDRTRLVRTREHALVVVGTMLTAADRARRADGQSGPFTWPGGSFSR